MMIATMFPIALRRALVGLLCALVCLCWLGLTPPASVSAATLTVTSCGDIGANTLRNQTVAAAAGDTIVFGQNCTVALASTLTLTKNVTIEGAGHTVTIQGNNTFTLLASNNGVAVNLIGLTFTQGKGSISNARPGNSSAGGAIFSRGALTVSDCTFDSNSAVQGGAINTNSGSLTVTASTFTNNSTFALSGEENGGGAIYHGAGGGSALTVTGSTFTNNHADVSGANSGAISVNGGLLTVIGSTFNGNTSSFSGGALSTSVSGSFITDSTFSNNSVTSFGAGSAIEGLGAVSIVNSTISGNNVTGTSAVDSYTSFTNVTIKNSIVSGNSSANCSRSSGGTFTDGGNNLEFGSTSCGFTVNAQTGDPNLGALANNGGPTQTMLPGVGSAATDHGNLNVCENANIGAGGSGPYDQRGALRTAPGGATCSIGAVEPGNTQIQDTTTLSVTANGASVANNSSVPYGASVILTATVAGARGETLAGSEAYTFKDGATTLGTGTRSVTTASYSLTANLTPGTHTFSVNAFPGGGIYDPSPTPNTIAVNITPISCQVTSTQDPTESGKLTLRDAVNVANNGACTNSNTITFAPAVFATPQTITLDPAQGQLTLSRAVTVTGPGSTVLTVARSTAGGTPQFRIVEVGGGVTAAINGLTITGGNAGASEGGGIRQDSGSTLTLSDVTVSGNRGNYGGGVVVLGSTLNGTNVTVSGNTSTSGGGGIATILNSTAMLSNVAVNGNTAGNTGGGFYIPDTSAVTLTNATVSTSAVTLTNATVSANVSPDFSGGGGMRVEASGTLTLTNVTVSGNSAVSDSGGISVVNTATLNATRSLIAGNTHGDVGGNGINGTNVSNLTAVNPLLAPLGSYGGTTQTQPPLPGSPAIDAGGVVCSASDQRGVARPVNTLCDIGAVESQGFAFSGQSGSPQSTNIGTAFGTPLGLMVSSSHNEPVVGGAVTFTRPSGAMLPGIAGSPLTAAITGTAGASTGTVSQNVTANGTGGTYSVIASAAGVPTSGSGGNLSYSLINTLAPQITSANSTGFIAGTGGSFTVTATGFPAPTFSATGLPTGVTLDMTSGALTISTTVAGTYTLTITASNGAMPDATQIFTLTINPAAAHNVAFVQQPTTVVAGAAITPAMTVQLQDQFGNSVPTLGTSVTLAIGTNPGTGTLSGAAMQSTDLNGLAAFAGLSINKSGTGYTLTASSTGLIGATSGTFNVTPGPAATLTITGYPSPVVSGTAHTFTVTAMDQYGSSATGYTGTIHFISTDVHATLPADTAFVPGNAGTRIFSATFGAAGTWNLIATDTTTGSITGTQSGIVVTAAPLASIAVAPTNATVKVGQVQQLTATGTYTDGSTADLTNQVAWSSDAPTVVSVDASGKATGQRAGSAHITATQGAISSQETVTVDAAIFTGVAPAPAPASRPSGAASPPSGPAPAPSPLPATRP
jgi:hypothetical protein